MKSMKWLAAGVAVCLCVPAALGGALLTQGSNEIGISGQLDTSGVAGTPKVFSAMIPLLNPARRSEAQTVIDADAASATPRRQIRRKAAPTAS